MLQPDIGRVFINLIGTDGAAEFMGDIAQRSRMPPLRDGAERGGDAFDFGVTGEAEIDEPLPVLSPMNGP